MFSFVQGQACLCVARRQAQRLGKKGRSEIASLVFL